MKKIIRNAIVMGMVLTLALSVVAQADTLVSPAFRLPGAESRPTEAPTVEPTAEPTAVPTEAPTEEPAAEPAVEPTEAPTAEPTTEPTAEPTAEPLPEPKVSISSNLAGKKAVRAGTKMVLTMKVENAADRPYTIQWQQSTDGGATWKDISGATAEQYALTLKAEHTGMIWRVTIDLK